MEDIYEYDDRNKDWRSQLTECSIPKALGKQELENLMMAILVIGRMLYY